MFLLFIANNHYKILTKESFKTTIHKMSNNTPNMILYAFMGLF